MEKRRTRSARKVPTVARKNPPKRKVLPDGLPDRERVDQLFRWWRHVEDMYRVAGAVTLSGSESDDEERAALHALHEALLTFATKRPGTKQIEIATRQAHRCDPFAATHLADLIDRMERGGLRDIIGAGFADEPERVKTLVSAAMTACSLVVPDLCRMIQVTPRWLADALADDAFLLTLKTKGPAEARAHIYGAAWGISRRTASEAMHPSGHVERNLLHSRVVQLWLRLRKTMTNEQIIADVANTPGELQSGLLEMCQWDTERNAPPTGSAESS